MLSFVCSIGNALLAAVLWNGGLGLIPAERAAKVTDTGITWNYTTILNIIFLLVAAALLARASPPSGWRQRLRRPRRYLEPGCAAIRPRVSSGRHR
jgi:hypothetical protein